MKQFLNNGFKRISLAVRLLIAIAYRKLRETFGGQLRVMDYSLEHLRGFYAVNVGHNVICIKPDLAFIDDLNRVAKARRFRHVKPVKEVIIKPYEHQWLENNYVVYYAGKLDESGKFQEIKTEKASIQICYQHKDLKEFKRGLRAKRSQERKLNVVSL